MLIILCIITSTPLCNYRIFVYTWANSVKLKVLNNLNTGGNVFTERYIIMSRPDKCTKCVETQQWI